MKAAAANTQVEDSPWMTVQEVLAYLRVSRTWFYAHRSEFVTARLRGSDRLRVERASVLAYLERTREG